LAAKLAVDRTIVLLKGASWIICACLALVLFARQAIASDDAKRVLILSEGESNLPAATNIGTIMRETLRSKLPTGLIIYSEFLDVDRFPEPSHDARMATFLGEKYTGIPINLVIANGPRALDFMLEHRAKLFTGAPLLFVALGAPSTTGRPVPPDVIGIALQNDLARTVELALRLQPDARQLVVVTGTSFQDRAWEAAARRELSPYESRLQVTFLSGLPMPELLRRVHLLPRDVIVLYLRVLKDGVGQLFIPREVAKMLSDASGAPVYGVTDNLLEMGLVGGHMASLATIGREVAELAGRILAGEPLAKVSIVSADSSADYVNWLQLRRWGIDDSRLPPGTIVRFKTPSLWTEYRWEIIAAAGLLVVQFLLLVALLVQAARRRRAEEAARESEERVVLATESAKLGLWYWDKLTREFWVTGLFRELMGIEPQGHATLEHVIAGIHPDDRANVRSTLERALEQDDAFRMECRVAAPDGAVRWVFASGRLTFASRGKGARLMGIVADITSRKRAEADVADQRAQLAHLTRVAMLGELSGALAHELNQPLTAILSNAQAAQQFLSHKVPDLAEVRNIVDDIVSDDLRAGEIIQQVRSLFKKQEVQYEPVDLNGIVADVQRFMHSELVARGVRLTADLSPDLALVSGNHVQLQQVFLNLIMNACDALREGKGDRAVTISTNPDGRVGVQISVADNGPGIAPHMFDRLFEPFASSKRLGLGFGLYICQSIIRAHGGRIWASNNADRGATFWISLPTATREAR
jgi:PAS domain S-box-containing protein